MSEVRFSDDYRGGGTFYITPDEVEVDLSDIIEEISSEAMTEALKSRGEDKLSNADDDDIIKEVSERSLIRFVLEDESIEDIIDILGVEEVLAEIDNEVVVKYVKDNGLIDESDTNLDDWGDEALIDELGKRKVGIFIDGEVAQAFRTLSEFFRTAENEFQDKFSVVGMRFVVDA
jgi:hypothetical protein